ncbi:GrpB-like predicted nucleotidyltransferase (UPF0157 family) [Microbacterium sp. W4I4]|uniref:GrpB family protein n=1 Tax=Microbacterium sp. W4I4 TaxID=3042295 RepID=UPI0027815FD4|nr:GrpB family protein [Microbacterium sp. W4I4]MDQ0612883.1 GrpB-like predicted nucleotidyltransferase (UPF0157 family) [Microbacterium sp. W4I4]
MSGPEDLAVSLVAPRPVQWERRFAALRARILYVLPDAAVEHIGSTAVPGLPTKDVVDVLVGVQADAVAASAVALRDDGFDREGVRPDHAWLCLPSRLDRDAVVHVVTIGGGQWQDRLDFRDLLRASSYARESYLAVKRRLADGETGWGEYTAGKTQIMRELLDEHRSGQPISSSA